MTKKGIRLKLQRVEEESIGGKADLLQTAPQLESGA